MAYKDPEKAKAYFRAYNAQRRDFVNNPERALAEREAARIRSHNWALRNPERVRATVRRYTKRHPDRVKAHARRYREANRISRREYRFRYHYNITSDRYDSLLAEQNYVCAICGGDGNGKALAVDHDHKCCPGKRSCGKCVRGLICCACNRGLGDLRESPEAALALAQYLIKWTAK